MDRRDAGIALALIVATLCVYAQVGGHAFVGYDDPTYVIDNARVRAGLTLDNTVWAFTTFHFSNWHPLTWLSYMLDCTLFGPAPGAMHLVNLALHLAATLLVYAWLRRLTGAVWRSALVAALFALHPLHVESVAWISERKDVLSTTFGLLSLLAYSDWAQRGGRLRYLACFACLALGLMAKGMLVTWPFVFLLLDWWPLGRASASGPLTARLAALRTLVVEKLPFFALAAGGAVLTMLAQDAQGGIAVELSLPARVANAAQSILFYLEKTLWPVGLAFFYPHAGERFVGWQAFAAFALLAVLTALVLGPLRGRRYLTFGWLFFLGTLVPVSGLVQVGLQSAADRYTYVPLLGLFVALAWGLGDLAARSPALRAAAVALAAAGVAALAVLSHAQTARWRDSVTLFGHAVAVTAGNPVAETQYGMALIEQGRLGDGMHYLRSALERGSAFLNTRMALCNALLAQSRVAEANECYAAAVAASPDADSAQLGLGRGRLAAGDAAGALAAFDTAIRLAPEQAPAHYAAGLALLELGRREEAASRFEEALRLRPDWPEARQSLERARRER